MFSAKIMKQEGGKNGTNLEIYKTFDYRVSCKRSDDWSSKIRVILAILASIQLKGEQLLLEWSQACPSVLEGRIHRIDPSGRWEWLSRFPSIPSATHSPFPTYATADRPKRAPEGLTTWQTSKAHLEFSITPAPPPAMWPLVLEITLVAGLQSHPSAATQRAYSGNSAIKATRRETSWTYK